jgi:hypothetical protein
MNKKYIKNSYLDCHFYLLKCSDNSASLDSYDRLFEQKILYLHKQVNETEIAIVMMLHQEEWIIIYKHINSDSVDAGAACSVQAGKGGLNFKTDQSHLNTLPNQALDIGTLEVHYTTSVKR